MQCTSYSVPSPSHLEFRAKYLKFVPSDHATITPQDIAPQRRLGQLRTSQNQRLLLALQSVAPGDDFKLAPDCIFDGDYRVHLEDKRRQHRTKLVNRHRIVAFHQHVPAHSPTRITKNSILKLAG